MAMMLRVMSALMGYSIYTLHVRSVAKGVRPTATACVMALHRVDVVGLKCSVVVVPKLCSRYIGSGRYFL